MSNIIIQKYYLTNLSNSEFINIYLSGRNQTVALAFLMIVLFCAIQFLLTSSMICMLILFLFVGGSTYFKAKLDTKSDTSSIYKFQFDHLRSIGGIKLRKTLDLLKQPGDSPLNKATLRRLKLVLVERQRNSSINLIGQNSVEIEPNYLAETAQEVSENLSYLRVQLQNLKDASPTLVFYSSQLVTETLDYFKDTTVVNLIGEHVNEVHRIAKDCDHGASFFHKADLFRLKDFRASNFAALIDQVLEIINTKGNDAFYQEVAKEVILAEEVEALISEKKVISEISKILSP